MRVGVLGTLLNWVGGGGSAREDRVEILAGHACRVFNASNVHLISKMRTEHLTDAERRAHAKLVASQHRALSLDSVRKWMSGASEVSTCARTGRHTFIWEQSTHVDPPLDSNTIPLSEAEYFSPDAVRILGSDIGRPKHVTHKSNTFTAQLWLCDEEDFPLDLKVCRSRAVGRRAHTRYRNNSLQSLTCWHRQVHTLHD